MSTHPIKQLILALKTRPIINRDIINAVYNVSKLNYFKSYESMAYKTSKNTRELVDQMIGDDDTQFGIYSFDKIGNPSVNRFIFILGNKKDTHLYIKLMVDSKTHDLNYCRITLVELSGDDDVHITNFKDLCYDEIINTLDEKGIEL